jgi:flagellar export protein FliJ
MAAPFRLQPVLRYRLRREDACARVLAERVRAVQAAARHLAALREQGIRAGLALHDAARGGAPAGWIRVLAEVPGALACQATGAMTRLTAERDRAEQARRTLVKASQDRQVLERLRRISVDLHRRREDARAQREHDERAQAAHRWRRSAPGGTRRPR